MPRRQKLLPETAKPLTLSVLLTLCPVCGSEMRPAYCNHRRIYTLEGARNNRLQIRRCLNQTCPRFEKPYRPEMSWRADSHGPARRIRNPGTRLPGDDRPCYSEERESRPDSPGSPADELPPTSCHHTSGERRGCPASWRAWLHPGRRSNALRHNGRRILHLRRSNALDDYANVVDQLKKQM